MQTYRSLEGLVRGWTVASVITLAACAANEEATDDSEPSAGQSAAALATGEVTLFSPTDTPAVLADNDTHAAELGVRFRSDVAGSVTGIRYYRSAPNTGAHSAHLWSEDGQLLATATFASTRRTGWQTARFTSPVALTAGRTYVASYHTSVGRYSADNDYFSGKSKDSAPLHAPADGMGGANGVYHYGDTAFPTDSYRGSNYWVDAIFLPTSGAPVSDAGPTTRDAGAPTTSADAATTTTSDAAAPVPDAGATPPPSGAFPGAGNTGVPSGTTLTPSGSIDVTVANTVIDAHDVTGCITVHADNVTIKRSRIRGGSCWEPIKNVGGKNLQVVDTEIDGEVSATCGESITGGDYSLLRVNAHGCSDGPRLSGSGPIDIRDTWIHDLSNLPGDHGDGIQAYGLSGGTVTLVHNTIVGGSNAAFMTADGASGDMVIDGNLMAGGGFTLRVYDNRVWARNNLIVKGSYQFGPVAAFRDPGAADPGVTIVEWTNNRLCDRTDGSGVGALIAEP